MREMRVPVVAHALLMAGAVANVAEALGAGVGMQGVLGTVTVAAVYSFAMWQHDASLPLRAADHPTARRARGAGEG